MGGWAGMQTPAQYYINLQPSLTLSLSSADMAPLRQASTGCFCCRVQAHGPDQLLLLD